ncbi:GtrA-like protein [compost metagenome]
MDKVGAWVVGALMKSRIFKYGAVGVLGTLLHMGTLFLLVEEASMHPVVASMCGFVFVLIVSYFLNKSWTFEQGGQADPIQMLKYAVVSICGLLLNTAVMYVSVQLLHWHYMLGQVIVIAVVPLSNYTLNLFWTFRVPEMNEKKPSQGV